MKSLVIAAITMFCFVLPVAAQEEDNSPHTDKLNAENGFNALKIGAKLSDVKKLLQKDPIRKTAVFDTTDAILEYEEAIYLVDLKQPGYGEYHGVKIARIEVYVSSLFNEFGTEDKPVQTIDFVKIYLVKGDKVFSNLISTLMTDYGGGSYMLDQPAEGDERWSWWGDDVMLDVSNYYGEGTTKRDYYLVEFSSSKGG